VKVSESVLQTIGKNLNIEKQAHWLPIQREPISCDQDINSN